MSVPTDSTTDAAAEQKQVELAESTKDKLIEDVAEVSVAFLCARSQIHTIIFACRHPKTRTTKRKEEEAGSERESTRVAAGQSHLQKH